MSYSLSYCELIRFLKLQCVAKTEKDYTLTLTIQNIRCGMINKKKILDMTEIWLICLFSSNLKHMLRVHMQCSSGRLLTVAHTDWTPCWSQCTVPIPMAVAEPIWSRRGARRRSIWRLSYLSCPWCCCGPPLAAGPPSLRRWPLVVCRFRRCSLCRHRSCLRRYRPTAKIRSHRNWSFSCRPPANS